MVNFLKFVVDNINAQNILLIIIPIFLVICAFIDILVQSNVYVGEYHDILVYQLPHLIYADGGFPLWNNLWITGFPEFSSPQTDIYYPLTLPLSYLIKDLFIQANFGILFHLVIAFFASYLLLSIVCSKKVYWIMFSILYVFSALMLSRVYAGHELIVFSLSWTPALYYATAKIILKNEISLLNILVFITAGILILLTGALYYIVYPFIFIGIFALYSWYTHKSETKSIIALFIASFIIFLTTAVKTIPILSITDQITRIDALDPLGGGGSFESNLASIIFGTSINKGYWYTGLQYGIHESTILIGAAVLFLIIFALVYGNKWITVPSFMSIIFAFIWADGGKTIFSFIHLLPFLSSFRCPGRIFGSLLPLLIVLALYGLILMQNKIQSKESFALTTIQKRNLTIGIIVLGVLKASEFLYQEALSYEAICSCILVAAFIALIFFEKLSVRNIILILGVSIICNAAYLIQNYAISGIVIAKSIVIAGVIFGGYILLNRRSSLQDNVMNDNNKRNFDTIALMICASIVISCIAGLTYIKPAEPNFESSPANAIITELTNYPSDNAQAWAATTGWPFQDIKYTYFFMTNGIHSQRGYNAYYLNTMLPLSYNIGNTQYFTSDYIVDTAYLDSGNLAIQNYTFMADGVPVTVMENVLPNAFILRNGNEVIKPTVEKFTPDEVVITGDFKAGDIAVLKTAYYDGWKINDADAVNAGNMPATELKSDTQRIVYKFAPASFTIGLTLTIIGIIILIAMIVFRKRVEELIK